MATVTAALLPVFLLMFRPSLAASVAVFLKLVVMPVIAVTLALQFGLNGSSLAIVTVCSAVPTSSSAYVMARQMGGDAPLLAQIITLQTILAGGDHAGRDCAGEITRHCERSEAIHSSASETWIASSPALPCTNALRLSQAMTRREPDPTRPAKRFGSSLPDC